MSTWKVVLIILGACAFIGIILGLLGRGFESPFLGSGNIGYVEVKGTIRNSRKVVEWIDKLSENSSIRAILVRIDSPGGGVAPSQEIYDALKRAREKGKPVVASIGSLGASGGYYIACAADKIVADPGSVTGSIGVIMQFPVIRDLLRKLGIDYEVIKSGEFKDIASPLRPMTDKERRLLKEVILDVYSQFVDVVAESRGLPKDSVLKIADGRILSGRQAYELGLVDTLGSQKVALDIARELGGIKGKPRLLKRKKRRIGLFDILFGTVDELLTPVRLEYRMEVAR